MCAGPNLIAVGDVPNVQINEITAPELAVGCWVRTIGHSIGVANFPRLNFGCAAIRAIQVGDATGKSRPEAATYRPYQLPLLE